MTSAFTAATWLVWQNDAQQQTYESEEYGPYEGITHLKLQKLLYFAQGIHLAMNGKPLFPEKIMAWRHGPVVEEVYQKLKSFGSEPIAIDANTEAISAIKTLDSQDEDTLLLTYDNFAIFTAWQLRNMTHETGTPWDVTVKKHGLNSEIDLALIKNYFLHNVIDNG
ncbi:MAG: DUF4065 domain-containing protein [Clostridiales bacterium]|nr:DUF4065 domain-containing protein [Clostridiales bacterium]